MLMSIQPTLSAWRKRVQKRLDGAIAAHEAAPNAEMMQARIRVVIAVVFLIYGFAVAQFDPLAALESNPTNLRYVSNVIMAVFAFAFVNGALILSSVRSRPGDRPARRAYAMLSDYGCMAAALAGGGYLAMPVFAIVVWVTVGNGLRFGFRYLIVATVLAAVPLVAAFFGNSYYRGEPLVVVMMAIMVLLVPIYLYSLLAANTRITNQLRTANQAKSIFISTMSHELRGPLNGILGMSRMLQATPQSEDQRECTDVIYTSATALSHLVEDVLDMAAVESGKVGLVNEPFALTGVLARIEAMHAAQARKKGLVLAFEVESDVPAAFVGDAHRISQILTNLVGNAVKFTEVGGVTLRVRGERLPDERQKLFFEVCDTGIGISDADKAKIFRPFVQAESGRTRRYDGTGLGTSISQRLARHMDGEVTVRDNAPQGSVFTFSLPLEVAAVVAPPASANVISIKDMFALHRRDVSPMRVLVVEDQSSNSLVLEKLLTSAGHTPILFSAPEAALDYLADNVVDLLMLDIHIPHMSGIEVLRHVRMMEAGARRKCPAVFLTGDATADTRAEALASGAQHFLIKPMQPERVLEVLAAVSVETRAVVMPRAPAPAVGKSQVQLLREAALDDEVIDNFVRLALSDIATQRQRLEAVVFTKDRTAWAEASETIRRNAVAIDALDVAELAAALRSMSQMDNARLLAALRRLDGALSRVGARAPATVADVATA